MPLPFHVFARFDNVRQNHVFLSLDVQARIIFIDAFFTQPSGDRLAGGILKRHARIVHSCGYRQGENFMVFTSAPFIVIQYVLYTVFYRLVSENDFFFGEEKKRNFMSRNPLRDIKFVSTSRAVREIKFGEKGPPWRATIFNCGVFRVK